MREARKSNSWKDLAFPFEAAALAVAAALAEDGAGDDVTTRWSVPADLWTSSTVISRATGVVAGLPVAAMVMAAVDSRVTVHEKVADGDHVEAGEVLLSLDGPARSLISGERTMLNLLQRMSGIASLTSHYVDTVADLGVQVLDTRKTAPGLRALDKYAVRAGGGTNHRLDLTAMVLLKENHVTAAGGVMSAVNAVRDGMVEEARDLSIEVEVRTLGEAREAMLADVEWVMLDNMSPSDLVRAVAMRCELARPRVKLEASGSLTLESLREVAETGVDAISVGALTHSAPALDLSLLISGAELSLDPPMSRAPSGWVR